MVEPHARLAAPEQGLGHLLARPQPGVDDVNLAWRAGGQPARDVGDAHLLSHVEHEDLAVPPDHRGLQHELHGLANGHEVPADPGMGNGQRAARGGLRAEGCQERSPAAQDIAEPDA